MKKYWEIIADNLKKIGLELWAGSQPPTTKRKQSGLLTRIAATESVSLCVQIKYCPCDLKPCAVQA
jgi:hypothetical protein